ncbi:hypothetical protein IscW_ISCW000102 [Ixodes scapularis]|uniref:Uncharacterized protein n=1 Tax=Ixodes scapularis TaxID=6945 RepID=B7P3T8_IXOSC|nr:hypothetical protein IscW_ISCW000102 [Ixodes scapularis]|eukprot:XP_002404617.1 hypothetical protein IscW_ISCW000102 [Ixodes scapularis]
MFLSTSQYLYVIPPMTLNEPVIEYDHAVKNKNNNPCVAEPQEILHWLHVHQMLWERRMVFHFAPFEVMVEFL